MKNINIIMLFTSMVIYAMPTMAQRPVGDTIVGRELSYLYANWPADTIMPGGIRNNIIYIRTLDTMWFDTNRPHADWHLISLYDDDHSGNFIGGREIVLSEPISVIGIAACAFADSAAVITQLPYYDSNGVNWSGNAALPSDPWVNAPKIEDTDMSHRATEYLQLYNLSDGIPSLADQGPWRHENPHRRIQYTLSNEGRLSNTVLHLQEVLFDKATNFDTNFLVAGTATNNNRIIKGLSETSYLYHSNCYFQWEHCPTIYQSLAYIIDGHPDLTSHHSEKYWCKIPGDTVGWRHRLAWVPGENQVCDWTFEVAAHLPLLFPILDTNYAPPCTEVQRLRRTAYTDSTVTVMWNAGARQTEWEVAYGLDTALFDNYQVINTTAPTATLRNMIGGARYCVRVRGVCRDTSNMGPWCAPICFNAPMPDTTGTGEGEGGEGEGGEGGEGEGGDTTGIAQPTNLDLFTNIMPNPASGQVVVTSSYGLYHLYAYDLQGRTMLDIEVHDRIAAFDVSSWPQGVYVVAIRTPQGLATKRLVVD